MVTIIKTNGSIRRTIAYNENKVTTGVAQCIGAVNYPVDLYKISTTMKLKRFTKRAELNEIAKRNTIHISLNFDPSENHPKEILMTITNIYMEKIGFAKQPYLVYEHYDAGHQHLHIISTNIQKNGTRIDLYNIGINKSEPARREIEKRFGLVQAVSQRKTNEFSLYPTSINKVHYGKMESKNAISKVLNYVLNQYTYTNLWELNAVLNQYNIIADRCKENSKTFLSGGLLYKILNEQGKPIGIPIKASSLDGKPTLKFLENNFKINTIKSIPQRIKLKKIVDLYLQRATSINELVKVLQKQNITTVLRRNLQDDSNEITYIDHKTKSILSGGTLAEQFTKNALTTNNELKTHYPNKRTQLLKKNNYGIKL